MSQHRIRFVGTDQCLDRLGARTDNICKAWPDITGKPEIVSQSIDENLLNNASSEIAIDDGAVLLVSRRSTKQSTCSAQRESLRCFCLQTARPTSGIPAAGS